MKVSGFGPTDATIMLVGEAPGNQEEVEGRPFVGPSGQELRRMLAAANLSMDRCWRTNVCKWRPPDNDVKRFFMNKTQAGKAGIVEVAGRYPGAQIQEGMLELEKEIKLLNPKLIIALGDTALWALTGNSGIMSWRGSQLNLSPPLWSGGWPAEVKVVPTYHPAAILRQWNWRSVAVHDLRRAKEWLSGEREPLPKAYITSPSYPEARKTLTRLMQGNRRLAVDIETRAGFTACVGIAWSSTDAICIPWMTTDNPEGFYSLEEELDLREMISSLLSLPNVEVVMQNGVYDCAYFIREESYCPPLKHDTMLAQHALFPGTQKGLDYLASLYCNHYTYWKGESKDWDVKVGERQLWEYNCKDACATWEIIHRQLHILESQGLTPAYQHLMDMFEPVMAMQTVGIRWDEAGAKDLGDKVRDEMKVQLHRLKTLFGHSVNPRSPYQLKDLFYNDFGIPPIRHPKTRKDTLDEAALTKIKEESPIFSRAIDLILGYRQNSVLLSTFLEYKKAPDRRFHTSFNIGGTETFRFSSSSNAFREGTNGQNIPPPIKFLLKPDPGYVILDWDLNRADAQVVAWEADDNDLKEVFRSGINLHIRNARVMFESQVKGWSDEAIKASDGMENRYERYYYLAKTGVHATNYLVQDRTLARTLGITQREAGNFRSRWLGLHPRIAAWHRRIQSELQDKHCVYNRFGFRRFYFDRLDMSTVQAALAWIPQSTVALVISKGMINLYRNCPWAWQLLQVHDSLVIQVKEGDMGWCEEIQEQLLIPIPYEDPLVIPVGFKSSNESWGACG